MGIEGKDDTAKWFMTANLQKRMSNRGGSSKASGTTNGLRRTSRARSGVRQANRSGIFLLFEEASFASETTAEHTERCRATSHEARARSVPAILPVLSSYIPRTRAYSGRWSFLGRYKYESLRAGEGDLEQKRHMEQKLG